ncbi:MAG: rRNA maturation RNase YbeY [Gammaproteobacteria bacterium]|nr:rRNA maturation RNase YbeY [Gammaproteobacteria bacterium]
MNVTVDLEHDCPGHWAPAAEDIALWFNSANESIARDMPEISVSVKVISEQDSARLNKQYRGKDKPTNVLSFTSELPPDMTDILKFIPLGDIAICAPVVEAEARQQGKALNAHWAHLLTHGFLHLSGYQHDSKSSTEEMESLEIAILDTLGFPNPYIIN